MNSKGETSRLIALLLDWYKKSHRDLPWRNTRDPYKIWISEIILQQTRVSQGLPYYLKFIEKYPNLESMAQENIQNILTLWQGLGYYNRAINMHTTAQHIYNNLNNIFPNTYSEIKELKGIGDYTAAAIASFAFNEKIAVLDGNVYRVLARLFGITDAINLEKNKKKFFTFAQNLLPEENTQIRIYNQAIMEFGALRCIPIHPICRECPLAQMCIAFKENKQKFLPVRISQRIKKKCFYYYFVFKVENGILMKCRNEKGIWKKLYDFYLIETKSPFISTNNILYCVEKKAGISKEDYTIVDISKTYIHLLSHRRIFALFFLIHVLNTSCIKRFITEERLENFNLTQLENIPKPTLIKNYLNNSKKYLT